MTGLALRLPDDIERDLHGGNRSSVLERLAIRIREASATRTISATSSDPETAGMPAGMLAAGSSPATLKVLVRVPYPNPTRNDHEVERRSGRPEGEDGRCPQRTEAADPRQRPAAAKPLGTEIGIGGQTDLVRQPEKMRKTEGQRDRSRDHGQETRCRHLELFGRSYARASMRRGASVCAISMWAKGPTGKCGTVTMPVRFFPARGEENGVCATKHEA